MNDIKLCEFLYLPTTRCNCRCRHCAPQVYTGKSKEMTSREMIEQYEKSYFLKNNSISVAGGEPFLKEDLDEFIVYLDEKKIPTVISTNGWFTDRIEKLVNKLKDTETVRFAISIDGPEEIHDEIRRCKGIYQRAVQSALLLKDRGFQVQINMVVQKGNLEYLEEFDAFFKGHQIPVIYIPEVFVGEDEFSFTKEEIREMFRYIDYPRGRKYLLSQGKWTIKNCHAGRNSWMIDCNGDVYACWGGYYKDNAKEYLMGNLYESDFDEIFTSEGKESVCRNVVQNCEGCLLPRDIERETDFFGYSTRLLRDEVEVLADELTNISKVNDYAVEAGEWYAQEKINGEVFRWMRGRKATLYVNVREKNPGKVVLHYLNGYVPSDGAEGICLSLLLDGKYNIDIQCEPGENLIEIPLRSGMVFRGLVEIELGVNFIWKPTDINPDSADTRELGVGIFSIGLV